MQVVRQTRARTAGRAGVPWLSAGGTPYAEVIDRLDRDPEPPAHPRWQRLVRTPGVTLTQTIKHRQRRRLVRVEVRATIGPPAAQPHPVQLARLNGVLRDRLACLTRKTHAVAKTTATWDACVGLARFAHNWLQPHAARRQPGAEPAGPRRYQRRSPAMAIGLTDHVWSFAEFLMFPIRQ